MEVLTQFSVFLANKPGVLSQVFRELGRNKINVIALAMMDAMEHGVLRVIPEKPEKVREILNALNVSMTETDVLAVEMPNRPGAVGEVCERLANERVHINYVYCTTGARGGKTIGVFKVGDMKKAAKVLNTPTGKRTGKDVKVKIRRPAAGARR